MKTKRELHILDEFYNYLLSIHNALFKQKVSVIIPAYNEAKTIRNVVDVVKRSKLVDEIVVVDDGSKDETYEKVKDMDITVVRHKNNIGKGSAMKSGLNASTGQIILFLDADLTDVTPKRVDMLIEPIIKNEADFVKSYFSSYKNSKLSASRSIFKSILKHMFGELDIKHPLSGQFSGRRKFLEKIEFRNDYGIDISIVIDAVINKLRIKDVYIGHIKHRKRKADDIARINDEAIKAIVKKYDNYKSSKTD